MKAKLALWYVAAAITYSVMRLPVAAVLVGCFHQSGEPYTAAHVMRYPDLVVYFPFVVLGHVLRRLDQTAWMPWLLAMYDVALLVVLGVVATVILFRGIMRILRALLS